MSPASQTQPAWRVWLFICTALDALTLRDAESLSEKDLVASDLKYPDRTGETYSITYNPQQRYYYFPRMQADEPVLIRCFDSAAREQRGFPPTPALTTRPRRRTRRRARASRCAPWSSSRRRFNFHRLRFLEPGCGVEAKFTVVAPRRIGCR
jgi:hypothetical protein